MSQNRVTVNTNVDEFMSKFNYKIKNYKTNRQIIFTLS